MSIMFLYYSEEHSVKGKDVAAHTMDTNLISTGEFLMKFPSVQEHVAPTCHDEFFKVTLPDCLCATHSQDSSYSTTQYLMCVLVASSHAPPKSIGQMVAQLHMPSVFW